MLENKHDSNHMQQSNKASNMPRGMITLPAYSRFAFTGNLQRHLYSAETQSNQSHGGTESSQTRPGPSPRAKACSIDRASNKAESADDHATCIIMLQAAYQDEQDLHHEQEKIVLWCEATCSCQRQIYSSKRELML